MAYQLNEINRRALLDPVEFLAQSDAAFDEKVRRAVDQILANRALSPVVLLAGPSGSGKTTSSMKLREELLRRGIRTHTISMDNYFKTVSPLTTPRTRKGDYDFESPLCLDMELLDEHFAALNRGETVLVPHYDFVRHMRDTSRCTPLTVGSDEIAIFEGIHALNAQLTANHPEAFKIYLSARSNVLDHGQMAFKGTWMRLTRRSVRDMNFRGTEVLHTFAMWANIRRGEKLYISPFKGSANLIFDSALPYEVNVMAAYSDQLRAAIPESNVRTKEMSQMIEAFRAFQPISQELVAENSLLREFIGGGIYGVH